MKNKDIEQEIIKKIYKSETFINRILSKKYRPIDILEILTGCDTMSVDSKLSYIRKLSDIDGYKNYYDSIKKKYDSFQDDETKKEFICVFRKVSNGVKYDTQQSLFYSLYYALNYVNTINKNQPNEIDYFIIDMFDRNNPSIQLYSLYGKYDIYKNAYIYDINIAKEQDDDPSYYITESIFYDVSDRFPTIEYEPLDKIYVKLSSGDFYHAIVTRNQEISYVALNNSNTFECMSLNRPILMEQRICQNPIYTALHENDPGFLDYPNESIEYIRYLASKHGYLEMDERYTI